MAAVRVPPKGIIPLLWSALGGVVVLAVSKKAAGLLQKYPMLDVEGHWRCKFRWREKDEESPPWEQMNN